MYGKGRVYYSCLGQVKENWENRQLQTMYTEAIKWAMECFSQTPPRDSSIPLSHAA